jgi:hypothetical protein
MRSSGVGGGELPGNFLSQTRCEMAEAGGKMKMRGQARDTVALQVQLYLVFISYCTGHGKAMYLPRIVRPKARVMFPGFSLLALLLI